MSWITDKLLGYRRMIFGAETLPERGAIEFAGEGVTVTDDTSNKRTVVTIAAGDGSGSLPVVETYPAAAGEFYVSEIGELWGYAEAQAFASPLMYELNNPRIWSDRLETSAISMSERVVGDGVLAPAVTIYAYYVPEDNLVANSDDYAILRIWSRPVAGGARVLQLQAVSVPVGVEFNATGDWTAFVPVTFGADAGGSLQVSAGRVLTWEITYAGSGVSVPTGRLFVQAVRTAAFPPGA